MSDPASKFASDVADKLLGMQIERAPRNIPFAEASRLYDQAAMALVTLLRGAQGNATKKEMATVAHNLARQMATCKVKGD